MAIWSKLVSPRCVPTIQQSLGTSYVHVHVHVPAFACVLHARSHNGAFNHLNAKGKRKRTYLCIAFGRRAGGRAPTLEYNTCMYVCTVLFFKVVDTRTRNIDAFLTTLSTTSEERRVPTT